MLESPLSLLLLPLSLLPLSLLLLPWARRLAMIPRCRHEGPFPPAACRAAAYAANNRRLLSTMVAGL
ncbi:MAG TPA: hypothetical protein VFB06_07445 [Streptosporangiaceae bacterium]|nr:hypothetical protein [Streptosporangiaceae bacterium]